ncbi:MAG: glutamine amidotransferase family protein [Oscillospiraceae bacterium]|nr:glutamine amidotransferase family protein [Oscillospiraceae bacterium]
MRHPPLEGQIRIPSGCAISGVFHKDGKTESGRRIIDSIALMHDRSNGLGGGFAGYGIYPEYKELYALHIFYLDQNVKQDCEEFIREHFDLANAGEIKTRNIAEIRDAPKIWRYFIFPHAYKLDSSELDEREYVAECVFAINRRFEGKAAVFSSGKNMGVFKANAFPEDVGRFYMLEDYSGYAWTAHGRYPTNTPGWWGGAHPFSLLDYSVVHNGEISSYDANRRNVEMFGYDCKLRTDTEVITYIFDYLTRREGLTFEEASAVVAAPFWSTIELMPDDEKEFYTYLRKRYHALLINGPFSIILGFTGGMLVLGDRLKLRSMVVAEHGDTFYAASEESAIRLIQPELDRTWAPDAGEAIIVKLYKEGE